MDVAASVVGLASFGVKLSTTLYSYSTTAASADKDISDIAKDVATAANVLVNMGLVLKDEETARIASEALLKDVRDIIDSCETVFNEIQEIVQKRRTKIGKDGKNTIRMIGRLMWPLKEQRVELLQKRLNSLSSRLSLVLNVLNLAANQANG